MNLKVKNKTVRLSSSYVKNKGRLLDVLLVNKQIECHEDISLSTYSLKKYSLELRNFK